jgi:hypothetical protein
MKMSEAFPAKWLSAPDLKGKDITLTISDVRMEEVGTPPERLPAVYFRGAGKGLVLNKTNGQTIADQLGDDTDHWIGKQITIFPTSTDFQGRQVACIRVRPGSFRAHEPLVADPSRQDPLNNDPLAEDRIPF